MVQIKKNIIKRRRIKLSIPVLLILAAVIIVLSIYVADMSIMSPKIVYMSSLLAMPEGFHYKINQLKVDFFELLSKSDMSEFIQNSGSINDLIKNRQTADLTVTPDDIVKNTEKIQKMFDDGKYEFDGVTVEKTFTDNQATDSFENIYVRNVTADSQINIESIINTGCFLPIENFSEPTVLIYHTHSTESYIMTDSGEFSSDYPSRNDDKSINMVRVGDEITAILEEKGIGVVHDRTIYDSTYTGAYDKSRDGIEKILKKYPSIIITLDIHRDAIYYDDYTRVKPVTEIDGVKAAQMMIIAGAEGGNIESFPDWEKNLSFAVNLQKAVNNKYENLMKPIYFCNRKYNMDITPYSLLIEVGTDVNTLSEAAYSGRLLGDVLSDYIKNNIEEREK